MTKHKDFILTPIISLLEESISSSQALNISIATYPIWDYIFQSTFLKMTGFQEQKMKCIVWEIATNDYDYRYKKLKSGLSECSTYMDKESIFNELINQIKKLSNKDVLDHKKRRLLMILAFRELKRIIRSNPGVHNYGLGKYNEFRRTFKNIKRYECILNNHTLSQFQKTNEHGQPEKNKHGEFIFINHKESVRELQKIYTEHLYKNRNRIAHNLLSYQQNLPKLNVLRDEEYKYENYFLWFYILILIDKLFIELYKEYMELLD